MDLNQLNALLAGLGPWGILIGAGVTLAVQWWRHRQPPPGPPPAPDQPAPAPSNTPLLDAVLNLLRLKLLRQAGPVAFGHPAHAGPDIDPATADRVLKALGG